MTDIDYKVKYEELCKKLMHEFTLGGSEFWMDPDRCIEFAKNKLDYGHKQILHTRTLLNHSRLLRWLWNRTARSIKRRRTQCQKRH